MNRKTISILMIFMVALLALGVYGTTNAGVAGVELSNA
jgi:hypothetical protein